MWDLSWRVGALIDSAVARVERLTDFVGCRSPLARQMTQLAAAPQSEFNGFGHMSKCTLDGVSNATGHRFVVSGRVTSHLVETLAHHPPSCGECQVRPRASGTCEGRGTHFQGDSGL